MLDIKSVVLPEAPGVYIFKDSGGKILYVGKSNNIRERVRSYFQGGANLDPRIRAMIDKVSEIEYIQCSSELEATFKEASLIRDVQPKYNIALKDGKSFPLMAIVYSDDFPYIAIKRETDISGENLKLKAMNSPIKSSDQKTRIEYFGPLKNKKMIQGSIQVLQSIFKFRTCDMPILENDKNRRYFKPCLLYYIKMCSAPCALKIGKEEYMENIKELKKFLDGKGNELIEDLSRKMKFYAKNLQFERAASVRDKINLLNSINERLDTFYYSINFDITKLNPVKSLESIRELFSLNTIPTIIDGIDISNIRGRYATGAVVRFVNGYPEKSEYRRYRIKTVDSINDIAMMIEVVNRRFSRLIAENGVLPHILLLDGGLGHLNMIAKALDTFKTDIFLVALAKYENDHIYTLKNKEGQRLDPKNPGTQLLTFVRDEAHRFAQSYHKVLRKNSISFK